MPNISRQFCWDYIISELNSYTWIRILILKYGYTVNYYCGYYIVDVGNTIIYIYL